MMDSLQSLDEKHGTQLIDFIIEERLCLAASVAERLAIDGHYMRHARKMGLYDSKRKPRWPRKERAA